MIRIKYFKLLVYGSLITSLITGCDELGSIPIKDDHLRMRKSSNYSKLEDQFLNENPSAFKEMRKTSGFWSNPKKNLSNNFFFNYNTTEPENLLPEDKSSLNKKFLKSDKNIKFAWLGHSSILMSINNNLLFI